MKLLIKAVGVEQRAWIDISEKAVHTAATEKY